MRQADSLEPALAGQSRPLQRFAFDCPPATADFACSLALDIDNARVIAASFTAREISHRAAGLNNPNQCRVPAGFHQRRVHGAHAALRTGYLAQLSQQELTEAAKHEQELGAAKRCRRACGGSLPSHNLISSGKFDPI